MMIFIKCLCRTIFPAPYNYKDTIFYKCSECNQNRIYDPKFVSATITEKQEVVSISSILNFIRDINKDFHNCPALLGEKKKLEKLVKFCKIKELRQHFNIKFSRRKKWFYLKIVEDIFDTRKKWRITTELQNIIMTTKTILRIYDEKTSRKEYYLNLIQLYEDEEENLATISDQQEEMRESLIDDHRYD